MIGHMIDKLNWGDLTPEKFLADYWQKKPLIIKNAFENFEDLIEPDELAGLAMEEFIESRIIAKPDSSWQVKHGPFEDFSEYGESNWTLLVQAVNHWNDNVQNLIKPFSFLPYWRIDDVMVSFSTPNGGVGPHLDQYDVFILQGMGKRRWRVGLPDSSLKTICPHEDLKQVSDFTAVIDEVTEAGDLLYIPPNHPHDGVAIDNALNYSVGFQAPSSKELTAGFADFLIDQNLGEARINDPERKLTEKPQVLSAQDIQGLRNYMFEQANNPSQFNHFIGRYLTQSHHNFNLWIPETELTVEQVQGIITEHDLVKVSGIKSLIVEENEPALFINGDIFALTPETIELAHRMATQACLTTESLNSSAKCLNSVQLLTNILNKGYWYLAE